MPATKKTVKKQSISETRKENEELHKIVEKYCRCAMCGKLKDQETKFYLDTNPVLGGNSFTRICRDCAKAIACRRDKNGEDHEPTKESVILALSVLDKPFIELVWNASIQEASNMYSGRTKSNVWVSYIKNIQMIQYVGKTFKDSDMFKDKVIYSDELTEKDILDTHQGQDNYDSFTKNKEDVIRLLDYDPFEKESISDQPFLYAQLLALLDSSEETNEDMIRTSSAISIARGFLQASKIDDSIANLMTDLSKLEKNSATIKSLQSSKSDIMRTIKDLAAESCLSLKNSKHSIKGENTWTGKVKKIRDLNLRNSQVNGFDIATCRGMQQVQEISDASIMKQLALDESEWSDMVAEMRVDNQKIRQERDQYKEINRILLRENIDLKDYLDENNIKPNIEYENLKEIYSVFGNQEEEGDDDEQDSSSE